MFGRAIPEHLHITLRRDGLAESLWEYGEDAHAERVLGFSESELYETQLLAVWHHVNDPEPTTGPRLKKGRVHARAAIEFLEGSTRDTRRSRRRTRAVTEKYTAEHTADLLAGRPTRSTAIERGLPGEPPPPRLSPARLG